MSRLPIAVTVALLLSASQAMALNHLVVEGVLKSPGGATVDGTYPVKFSLYASSEGGQAIWTEPQASLTVKDGFFQARLGESQELTTDIFAKNAALWLGIALDVGGTYEEFSQRTPLETDPFAFRAQSAAKADDAGTVGGYSASASPTANALLVLDSDGKVPISALPAASQVACSGCIEAAAIADGTLPIAKLGPSGCEEGQTIAWSGSAWTCATSTYAAGTGLVLTGSTFSLDETTIKQLARDAAYDSVDELNSALAGWDHDGSDDLTLATIFDGDVVGTFQALKIKPGSVSLSDLAPSGCEKDELAEFDGSKWACATDEKLTEAEVNAFVEKAGYAKVIDLSPVALSGAFSALKDIPPDKDVLGALSCGTGEVPKYNDGAWGCAPGSGVGATGTLSGRVTVFGKTDHTGVTVEVVGTAKSGTTAADGTFAIVDIPIGNYKIRFSYPSFAIRTVPNILVLSGEYLMPDVAMRRAISVDLGTGRHVVQPSFDGKKLVVGATDGYDYLWTLSGYGNLAIHDLDTGLSDIVGRSSYIGYWPLAPSAFFAADGKTMLFLDDTCATCGTASLVSWNMSSRVRSVISTGVQKSALGGGSPDRKSFTYWSAGMLNVRDMSSGVDWVPLAGSPVNTPKYSANGNWMAVAADYVNGVGGRVILCDMIAKSTKTLTVAGYLYGFTPDGSHLIYCEGPYEACAVRSFRLQDEKVSVGPSGFVTSYSPTAANIAILTPPGTAGNYALTDWTLGNDPPVQIHVAAAGGSVRFASDGTQLFYMTGYTSQTLTGDLYAWNMSTSTSGLVAKTVRMLHVNPMPVGADLLMLQNFTNSKGDLYYWYAGTASSVLVAKDVGVEPGYFQPPVVPLPDGSMVLYLVDYVKSNTSFGSNAAGTLMAWSPVSQTAIKVDSNVLWRNIQPAPNSNSVYFQKNAKTFAAGDYSTALVADLSQWSPTSGVVPIDNSVLVNNAVDKRPIVTDNMLAYVRYFSNYPELLESGIYAVPLK